MLTLANQNAYKRWCEYTQRCGAHGLSWPEWREAYNGGLIR